jgi:hypothetical protein
MNRLRSLLTAMTLWTVCCGCRGIETPNWFHPGDWKTQRERAKRYDPYAENEPGPPMEGIRPREYDKPPPEPSRARWHLGGWGR